MFKTTMLPALFCISLVGLCRADPVPQVTATGTANLTHVPETIRMTVDIVAEGKDAKEALAALATKRDAFKHLLDASDAKHETMSDPHVAGASDPRRQLEMMMGNRGAPPAPPSVKLSMTIKADWPLTGASAEERLLNSAAIQQQLKPEPDTRKTDAPTTQSEQQEEMAAAVQASGTPNPETPVFTYVAEIPEADREKALAQAYNNAKMSATQVATAMGAALGGPLDVKASLAPTHDKAADPQLMYMEAVLNTMQKSTSELSLSETEASGPEPANVSLTVTVAASFSIQTK
jgi:uncharacterized protein YggE